MQQSTSLNKLLFVIVSFTFLGQVYAFDSKIQDAIEQENIERAAVLIDSASHSEINSQDERGMTLLMWAVASGNIKLVQLILQRNPDLELKNKSQDTALAMAIGLEKPKIASLLLTKGAKLNSIFENGENLLMRAVKVNMKPLALELSKRAPELIQQANLEGNTSLHFAVIGNSPSMVKLLLSQGAKKDVHNKAGQSPVDLARANSSRAIKKLL